MPDNTSARSETVLPARMSALPDLVAFAKAFCDRHGLTQTPAVRLRLVMEELFTNTVRHGHRGDSDAPVRIALSMIEGYVAIEYEDSAPAYDPLARMTVLPSDQVVAMDGPPTDALGTYLVGKTLYGARYAYEDGHNRLWLAMSR